MKLTIHSLLILSLGLSLSLACESGDDGDADNHGGAGGVGAHSDGDHGTGGNGSDSDDPSGEDDEETCALPYNGCAVPGLVKAFAGTYKVEAETVNSCSGLGILVPSGSVTVTGTFTIDGDSGSATLDLDDSDRSLVIDPTDADFKPRDFSKPNQPNQGRWYAYAREWTDEFNRGLSEGFNLQLNEALEFANVDDGFRESALRVYTADGCELQFALVD